jgi:hypothetical protein
MVFVITQLSRANYSFKAMAGFRKYRNYFWQEGKHQVAHSTASTAIKE